MQQDESFTNYGILVDKDFWENFCSSMPNAKRFIQPIVTSIKPFHRNLCFQKNSIIFTLEIDSIKAKANEGRIPANYLFVSSQYDVVIIEEQRGDFLEYEYYRKVANILNAFFIA